MLKLRGGVATLPLSAAIAAVRKTISQGFGPASLGDYKEILVDLLRDIPSDGPAFGEVKTSVAEDMTLVRQRLYGEGVEHDERDAAMEVVRKIEQMVGLLQEPTDADRRFAENASRHSGFTQRRGS